MGIWLLIQECKKIPMEQSHSFSGSFNSTSTEEPWYPHSENNPSFEMRYPQSSGEQTSFDYGSSNPSFDAVEVMDVPLDVNCVESSFNHGSSNQWEQQPVEAFDEAHPFMGDINTGGPVYQQSYACSQHVDDTGDRPQRPTFGKQRVIYSRNTYNPAMVKPPGCWELNNSHLVEFPGQSPNNREFAVTNAKPVQADNTSSRRSKARFVRNCSELSDEGARPSWAELSEANGPEGSDESARPSWAELSEAQEGDVSVDPNTSAQELEHCDEEAKYLTYGSVRFAPSKGPCPENAKYLRGPMGKLY
jgi:hypothetical protein